MRTVRRSIVLALTALAAAAATTPLHAQDSDRYVVAVLPFASSDDGASKDLQETVIADLDDLGAYTLVEQDDVNDALKDAGRKPGDPIDPATALQIGRDLGARIIARGTLEKQDDSWTADPVFVEVATRNTQDLPPSSSDKVDKLGDEIVASFNNRNQALKHLIFGRDYMRGQSYERAVKNFRQALKYDPELAAAYYYMGQAYLEQDSLNQALTALEKAVDTDPSYISAYHSIGQAYLEKGDTLQARNFFEQLVQKKPDDCDIQIAYGYVMANQLDEVQKGLDAFEKAKQLCPDNAAAYQYLALALPDDRRDEKIENYKKYLELSEGKATDPDALEYLFSLYFADQRYQEAEQTINQAVAADPSDPNLQLYAGIVSDKLQHYQDAVQHYTKALEINPDLQKAYLFRALAYKQMGNTQKYAQDLEKAGRGNASDILAQQFLREAALQLKAGRASAALEQLNRASQLGGNACAINYYRGDALYQMGKSLQGEEHSIGQNQRSIDLFQQAISSLHNACGDYTKYANGLINNANQYIDRGNLILKKLQRSR